MPDSMKNVTGRFPKNHILKRIRGFFGEKDIILEDRSKKFIFIQNFDYPEKPLKYKHIRRISD